MKTSIPGLQKIIDKQNKRNKELEKPFMERIVDDLKMEKKR